jgi:hypothetical protein
MQSALPFRTVAVLALVATLAACTGKPQAGTAGQTPEPSQTTLDQANSTAAPETQAPKIPRSHVAVSVAKAKALTFAIYVNGQPGVALNSPGDTDITDMLGVGNNTIAIRWKKDRNDGFGTVKVLENGKSVVTQTVRATDAPQGQKSVSLVAR